MLARVVRLCVMCWLALCGNAAFGASRSEWVTPLPPFRLADNLFYVGSRDLASYLVTTPAGNILINANLPSSPVQIRQSVERLGFRWSDTRVLLISHAHVDHAGGAATIVAQTGAHLEVMDGDVEVMESGGRSDFAFGHAGRQMQFPAVHVATVLHDGSEVSLGGVTLTAHKTAGHTQGCTTWTMSVHMPGDPPAQRRNVVIGGSWTVLSEYRLVASPHHPASYPGIAADFQHTFALLPHLPCDVFLSAHGEAFDMLDKLRRMPTEGDKVWIDPAGYGAAILAAQHAFASDLQRQAAGQDQSHPAGE